MITLNGLGALTFGGALTNTAGAANTLTVNNGTGTGGTTALKLGGYALSNSATSYTDVINGSGNVNITGAVTNGGTATASGLTYAGTGTLTLSGANTYAGATTVSGGTLNLNGGSLTGATAIAVNGGTSRKIPRASSAAPRHRSPWAAARRSWQARTPTRATPR